MPSEGKSSLRANRKRAFVSPLAVRVARLGADSGGLSTHADSKMAVGATTHSVLVSCLFWSSQQALIAPQSHTKQAFEDLSFSLRLILFASAA